MHPKVAEVVKLLSGWEAPFYFGEPMKSDRCPVAQYIVDNVSAVIPIVGNEYVDVFDIFTFEPIGSVQLPPAVISFIKEVDRGADHIGIGS